MGARLLARWAARVLLLVGVGLALGALTPAVAWARTATDDYPPSTTATTGAPCAGPNPNVAVCGTSVSRGNSSTPSGSSSTLPFTGGDVALLTVLGLGAAGGGVLLVFLGRRSRSTT